MARPRITNACPCGLGQPYDECCGPAHRGQPPVSAEALMRSRYAAFALDDTAYVLSSWHPDTRPASVESDPDLRWVGLNLLVTSGGGMFDTEGIVEFVAHFRDGGQAGELREVSRFVRYAGRWVYWGPLISG
ncbi:MAG: motif domain protein [Actinoplanes sp.]|jgi:SEC-C motif-containing protein|nr:motif domain protein [Actinoplanes sp.]